MNKAVAALAVLAVFAADVPAGAQALTPETFQTGYRLFYEGDTAASIKHFKRRVRHEAAVVSRSTVRDKHSSLGEGKNCD